MGSVSRAGASLRVRWPASRGVLVARLPGRSWAELVDRDLLEIYTEHPSQPQVSLLPDPWSDSTIALAIPRTAEETGSPLEIALRPLDTAVARDVGRDLAEAVEAIGWLAALPSFREALGQATRDLEDELVAVRRAVAEREDQALRRELSRFARRTASAAAHRYDARLIDIALTRSQTRWELLEEYEARSQAEQLTRPGRCANCGAATLVAARSDFARPSIKRMVSTCSGCGIVADLPVWPLELSLDAASLRWIGRTLEGRARVLNRSDEAREIALGATLVGGAEIQAGSTERWRGMLGPGAARDFEFAVTHRRLVSGTMRFRVFIASRGGFGFVGGILLVPPGTLADRR
jgi:hypothetical protein